MVAALAACAGQPGDVGAGDEAPRDDAAAGAPKRDGATEGARGDGATASGDVPAADGGDGAGLDAGGDACVDGASDASDGATLDGATRDGAMLDGTVHDATTPIDAAPSDASESGAPDAAPDAAPVDAGPPLDCTKLGAQGEPIELGCTGLYGNWSTRAIASDVRPYDPYLHLWSDGAEKSRFIRLPPGTKIDTTNLDEWSFPVGTRLWKEFRLAGRKVETRMLWKKTPSAWVRTTYAWSYDQSSAKELTTGAKNVFGTSYEIPAQSDCETCHDGRLDGVLGFEIVGLSSAGATGLTMQQLIAQSLVTNVPASLPKIPGNATESGALGWLHANCGNACHNRSNYALAKSTGLFMRLEVGRMASVTGTDTYTTAVNVPSAFQPQPGVQFMRIRPRDPATSCIPYRDGSRVSGVQMPPLGTHVVDTNGLTLVKNWINSM